MANPSPSKRLRSREAHTALHVDDRQAFSLSQESDVRVATRNAMADALASFGHHGSVIPAPAGRSRGGGMDSHPRQRRSAVRRHVVGSCLLRAPGQWALAQPPRPGAGPAPTRPTSSRRSTSWRSTSTHCRACAIPPLRLLDAAPRAGWRAGMGARSRVLASGGSQAGEPFTKYQLKLLAQHSVSK